MEFITLNGKTLKAENFQGAAIALWQMMLVPEPTLEEWMAGSAKRALEWDGSIIRTSSPQEHIQDLITAGLLVQVK